MRYHLHARAGFSLMEVIVTLAVLCALISMLIPAVRRSREASRRLACSNNLHQIGLSLHSYHDTHRVLPAAGFRSNELSWHVHILPYIDQQPLYNSFVFSEGSFLSLTRSFSSNRVHGLTRVPTFLCMSAFEQRSLTTRDGLDGVHAFTTHYYGVMGPRGRRDDGSEYRMSEYGPFAAQGAIGFETCTSIGDMTDGASSSAVVAELSWDDANVYRTWIRGTNGEPMGGAKNVLRAINELFYAEPSRYSNDGNAHGFNDVSFGSQHSGGTHMLMGDGAARFLADTIDQGVYKAYASINGSEVIDQDAF